MAIRCLLTPSVLRKPIICADRSSILPGPTSWQPGMIPWRHDRGAILAADRLWRSVSMHARPTMPLLPPSLALQDGEYDSSTYPACAAVPPGVLGGLAAAANARVSANGRECHTSSSQLGFPLAEYVQFRELYL